MISVSDIKKYYGDRLDQTVLLLDINESTEKISEKISKFIKDKWSAYIDFIDYTISDDQVVRSYQVLKIKPNIKTKAITCDLHDIYNKMLETKVSNINASEIIDLIHKGIELYKNEQRIGE